VSSERTSTLDAPVHGPGRSDPPAGPGDAAGIDPELLALPAPPKRERTAAVVLMLITAIAAAVMAYAVLGEARYALTSGRPIDVGDLATLRPTADLANRYVRTTALLGTGGAVRYGRAAESDSFRLAPVAGNPDIWVEIRVPEGFEGPRFVPPTTFAGRLVPLKDAGIRHRGLTDSVREQTQATLPPGTWLFIDGTSPRSSRWALALAILFLGFAAWNAVGVARVLRRVKDPSEPRGPDPEGSEAARA
jgi:hypothetical protein